MIITWFFCLQFEPYLTSNMFKITFVLGLVLDTPLFVLIPVHRGTVQYNKDTCAAPYVCV